MTASNERNAGRTEVENNRNKIKDAVRWIGDADAVLISASNGLSISEGYNIYDDNDDFRKYFGYFRTKYGISYLLQGIFAKFPEHDAYMRTVHKYLIDDYSGSRVMRDLLEIVSGKDYFIVTSNADTHFQMNGFDPDRIYEIEGNVDGMDMYSSAWDAQGDRFSDFVQRYRDKDLVVFELGIGMRNTLLKRPLMDMVDSAENWKYITLNMPEAIYVPDAIASRSLAIAGDIVETCKDMLNSRN